MKLVVYSLECHNENCEYYNRFYAPIDSDDFRYCPECGSKKIELTNRREVDTEK